MSSAASFEAIVTEVTGPMREQARRILGDQGRAEEALQEALLRMWLHWERYDVHRGSVRSWAVAIVRHVAVDRVRSEEAAVRREALFAAGHGVVAYDEVAETVENVLEHERVRWCLEELSALQRQAVQLLYYDGLSAAQAAAVLGVPVSTLRTRVRDARAALAGILGVD